MSTSKVTALPEFNTKEILDLAEEDEALRRFFARLRAAERILVRDGSDKFVVEFQRVTVSAEARRILAGGDPVDD